MRIAFVTGVCPPGACGVGDYTGRLTSALSELGIDTDVLQEDSWRMLDIPSAFRALGRMKPDVVHIQYPTSGFGHHCGPQLLALMRRSVTTFHEVSKSHILRKLSLYPFTLRARHLIFTSEYERQFAIRWAPWMRGISSVIPIGSNIEGHPSNEIRRSRNCGEVVYFGLIMRGKGLENIVRLATLIRERRLNLLVRLVGSHRPEHAAYVRELRKKAQDLPIIWDEGLPAEQVTDRLAKASIAYLPYPDGASDRRATLMAALLNRIAVVTTRGPATPAGLEKAVRFSASPSDALDIILSLLGDESQRRTLETEGRIYVEKFSWRNIAQAHHQIYQQLVNRVENANTD